MDRFYGFDLGDAESAVSRLEKQNQKQPLMLTVNGKKSFITAYAALQDGSFQLGEEACYATDVIKRKLRFKSSFLTDPSVSGDVKAFAAGVLGELYGSGDLIRNEENCFYIGCPAGWNKNARERYRAIFEAVGYPPARIISESRAALVSACQSRHLQIGYDILSKPVLVVDIGSSTTDFAYVCSGKEVDIQTAGEVKLGGGIMDEILLENCVKASADQAAIREVFAESEAWRNYCEFAARRLKERYFADPDYWKNHPCIESVMIRYKKPIRLQLFMDEDMAKALTEQKVAGLANRSFHEVFEEALCSVKEQIQGREAELIFLTGGVSKLPAIRTWCEEAFLDSVVIQSQEPEFSVARGLAWCGRIDEDLREFKAELEELKRSTVVEDLVSADIGSLYRSVVDALVEPILRNAAAPVYESWRKGEILRLADTDPKLQEAIEAYLHSDEARALLVGPITNWLRPLSDQLEEYTLPICLRHKVPYTALSLKSHLAASDLEVRIDARNVFALGEITWMIDSIISVIVGLLCGGSGIALITSGLPGIIIGFVASFMVLALGKKQMESALLHADIPVPMRRLLPGNLLESRMDNLAAKVKEGLSQSLEKEKNDEITRRLTDQISEQIEECLTKMAEVVEIPLG